MVHVLAGHACISLLQTTALQEVWAKLHQLASEHPDKDAPMASFNRRISEAWCSDGVFYGPDAPWYATRRHISAFGRCTHLVSEVYDQQACLLVCVHVCTRVGWTCM